MNQKIGMPLQGMNIGLDEENWKRNGNEKEKEDFKVLSGIL